MKHVGLNVAADPLFTVSYTGINAGMVIAVADDPGMHSSQNEQDSRHYAKAAKLPMLEPADSSECYDFAKYAYGYTFDLGNYYKLNDAFTFESSISELNNYVNSHKR